MKPSHVGMLGLGVMGSNLALNFASKGFTVAGYDRDAKYLDSFRKDHAANSSITACDSIESFCAALERPRRIMLMVTAGKAVDWCIDSLLPHLEAGDILIDGGNSHFEDTQRRVKHVESKGLLYIGTGVSGGEEGARKGPSLMPGGSPAAWPHVRAMFEAIAAKVADGPPCCAFLGPDGAGHYVKMVHNGIEYGDMQLIAEAYALLRGVLGMTPADQAKVFAEWNKGELDSYLIDITARILATNDPETGKPMVDVVLDTAGQKGTGKWTSVSGLDLGVPIPTIAEAVFARCVSAIKDERVAASGLLSGPTKTFSGDRDAFAEDVRQALYASKICSYAQGFQLLRAASAEYTWDLNYGDIALLWRGGCIIRARFLDHIKDVFTNDPGCENLLVTPFFREAIAKAQSAWRRAIVAAIEHGVPTPAFSSALGYYDSYRSAILPANLLQAQRDYFGAHRYERVDKARGEIFHTHWGN